MSDLSWSRDGADWPNREASRFIDAGGIRWHVQMLGPEPREGYPQLLLIHGTGAATHSWRDLAPMLAQHFTVIAPDLPGHGFTGSPASHRLSLNGMASDLGQMLRALGVRPEVVVGHSAGAAILARMCLNGTIAPHLLISLNGAFLPFGGLANHLFSPLAKLMALNPLMARVFAWQASQQGTVERLIENTGSHLDPAGVAFYRRVVSNPAHVKAALWMMANWQLETLARDLSVLKPPLVLVAADNDRSVSPDTARRVRAIQPRATIVPVGGGHLAHEEHPQAFADLILGQAALAGGVASGPRV